MPQEMKIRAHVSTGDPADAVAESHSFNWFVSRAEKKAVYLPPDTTTRQIDLFSFVSTRMFVISPQKPIKLYWNQTIIGTLFVVVRGPLMMGCGAEPTAISIANVSAYPDGNVVTVWRCGD